MKKILFVLLSALMSVQAASLSEKAGSPTRYYAAIEQQLKQKLALELGPKVRTQVERFYLKEGTPANAELVTLQPHPPVGLVNLEVTWQENGQTRHSNGSASVKAYAPIAVAKSAIRHGDPFSEENIKLEQRELTVYRVVGFYDSLEALKSLRSNGFLSPGMVVDFRHTQVPLMVTQGDMLDLVKETATMRVVARVKALENGKLNQWIRVENPSSKRVIQARVVGMAEAHLN